MEYNKYSLIQYLPNGKKHLLIVIACSEEEVKMLAPEADENQFPVEVTFICSTQEQECRIVESHYCV